MVRGTLFVSALFFAMLEPIVPAMGDIDLLKYGITQGGLVLLVIVIVWSYRRDFKRVTDGQLERIAVMTRLVENNTTALTLSAAANDRMARAVEYLDRRRHT